MPANSTHGDQAQRPRTLCSRRAGTTTSTPAEPSAAAPTTADVVALFEQHQRRIYRYCYRRLGNAADAEDATQETFARAVVRLPHVSGDAAPYLSAIAHNVCYDVSMSRRRQEMREAPLDGLDRPDGGAGPEETTADRCVLARIVAALSGRERALLVQTYAGYSYEEIAARMGLNVKVVSVSIVRARQHLRRIGAAGLTALGAGYLLRRVAASTLRRAGGVAERLRPEGLAAIEQVALVAASLALLAVGTVPPGAVAAAPRGLASASPAVVDRNPVIVPVTSRIGGAPARSVVASVPPAVPATPAPRVGVPQPPAFPWLATDESAASFSSFTTSPAYGSDHTVFAAGAITNCQTVTPCGVVFTSHDGGTSWSRLPATIPSHLGSVVLLPTYPATPTLFLTTAAGLLRSDNAGQSFLPVVPLPDAVAAPLQGLDGAAPTVLVGSQTDPGQTWIYDPALSAGASQGPTLLPGMVAEDMAALPGDRGVMVAVGQAGGSDEDAVAPRLERCDAVSCTPLAELPQPTTGNLQLDVSTAYATDHTLALVTADTVYLSTDGGHSLRAVLRFATTDPVTTVGIGVDSSGQPEILAGERLFATLHGTVVLWRSVDGGADFSPARSWGDITGIRALEVLPDGHVLAAVAGSISGNNGVRCSADGGVSWSATC